MKVSDYYGIRYIDALKRYIKFREVGKLDVESTEKDTFRIVDKEGRIFFTGRRSNKKDNIMRVVLIHLLDDYRYLIHRVFSICKTFHDNTIEEFAVFLYNEINQITPDIQVKYYYGIPASNRTFYFELSKRILNRFCDGLAKTYKIHHLKKDLGLTSFFEI